MSTIKMFVLSLLSVWLLTTSCSDREPSSQQPDSGITIHQKVSPVLIGRERNPVLQVQLQGDGKLVNIDDPVSSLKITTEGTTDIEDIASVDVFYAGEERSEERRVGKECRSEEEPGRKINKKRNMAIIAKEISYKAK